MKPRLSDRPATALHLHIRDWQLDLILDRLDQLNHAALQARPLNSQRLDSLAVIKLANLVHRRGITTLQILRWEAILQLREVRPHDVEDLAVGEVPSSREQPLAAGLGLVHSQDVGPRRIPDVDPELNRSGGRDFILPLALQELDDALVGCVDVVQGREVVHDRTEDKGRADGCDVEVRLLSLDEVPRGLLGVLLGQAIDVRARAMEVIHGNWVP